MRKRQGSMLQSLRAVKSFLDDHADKLTGVVQTGARKRLDDAIAALDSHASDQTGSFIALQGLTQKQRKLRVVLLRDHMKAIARIAVADLPNTPEFAPLRMPRGRPTPERLAAAATGMAQIAAQHVDVFTAAGLPPDFVDQLNAAAESMVSAVVARTRSRGKRRGATTGLKAKLIEARQIVAILDAFVTTALADDPVLLSDWNTVIRISNVGLVAPTPTTDPLPSSTSPTSPVPATAAPAAPVTPSTSLPSTADNAKEGV